VPARPTSEWSPSTPFYPSSTLQRGGSRGVSSRLRFSAQDIFSRELLPGEADPELQFTRGATCDEVDSTLIVGYLRWLLSVAIDCHFQDDVNLSNPLREYLVDEMEAKIDSLSLRRQRQGYRQRVPENGRKGVIISDSRRRR
jgi:hypothetical protein